METTQIRDQVLNLFPNLTVTPSGLPYGSEKTIEFGGPRYQGEEIEGPDGSDWFEVSVPFVLTVKGKIKDEPPIAAKPASSKRVVLEDGEWKEI